MKLSRDEIVKILHDAEIVGCDPNAQYVIVVDRNKTSRQVLEMLSHHLTAEFNIRHILLSVPGNPHEAIAILELKDA